MRLTFWALLALAACATGPKPAPPKHPASVDAAAPIVIGESRQIVSVALGETRTYNVYLPPGYADGDTRYPVLYLLDGGLAQDFHHIAGLAQYGALSGHYEPMIVVGVETRDRRKELTAPSSDPKERFDFPTSGGASGFRAFLVDELKPAVNGRYRVDGREALMGESLAGLFVVDAFLNAPDTADFYIAISPSLWWDRGALGMSAPRKLADPRSAQRLYLAIASEKGVMRDATLKIVDALKKSKPVNVAWLFSDRPDLEHATIYHREALEAFEWAFGPKAK